MFQDTHTGISEVPARMLTQFTYIAYIVDTYQHRHIKMRSPLKHLCSSSSSLLLAPLQPTRKQLFNDAPFFFDQVAVNDSESSFTQ